MKNEIEVIDGVKGEWRTVTKPSKVKVGQRVRYEDCKNREAYGYDMPAFTVNYDITNDKHFSLFKGYWKNIQAFFPLADKQKRKVAKVRIFNYSDGMAWFETRITVRVISAHYSSRKSALRGARRFCEAIGYECEIQKEVK
jgi:hypothetical protein